jgi:protease PrsW
MPLLIILILIIVAILPALIWLMFFLREDIHPEPRRLIIRTFLIGAAATAPALVLQIAFKNFIGDTYLITSFIGLAIIEEAFKFFAAHYSINHTSFFDEPIDAMIYMVAAASGFATVENILIGIGSLNTLTTTSLLATSNVILLRFVGATLLHILASAIIGYYWAKTLKCKGVIPGCYAPLAQGFILATVIHVVFNYFVATTGNSNLLYSSLVLIVAAFFVFNDFEILKKKTITPSHLQKNKARLQI